MYGVGSRLSVICNAVFSFDFETQNKGEDGLDFVTSIDLEMQRALERDLVAMLPGSRVIGEEAFAELGSCVPDVPIWLVDPLDGTVNFVAGLPCYAVSVVLIVKERTRLAVVRDVVRGTTYSGIAGGGAFVDGIRLVRRRHPARLATLSSGLLADLSGRAPDVLRRLLTGFKLRNFGSQALHLCFAAAGHLALVASREAKGWDDMAGALIATEAGLTYGHYGANGRPPISCDQYSLCALPDMFDEVAEALACSTIERPTSVCF